MTLYEMLGIPKDAAKDAIKSAYRKAAKKAHPDAGGDVEKFGAIQKAYDVLSDEKLRNEYDETGQIPDDTPERSARSEALGTLTELFLHILDRVDTEKLAQFDLMGAMRKSVDDNVKKIRTAIAEREKLIKLQTRQIEVVKARLVKKGEDSGFFLHALTARMKQIQEDIAGIEKKLCVYTTMREILEEYTFVFEKGPERRIDTTSTLSSGLYVSPWTRMSDFS